MALIPSQIQPPMPAPGATQIPTALARPPSALPMGHAVPATAGAGQQTPAAGLQAQAHLMLGPILRDLQLVLSMVPTGEPLHKDTLHAIQSLSKHAPDGISTAELTIRQLMQAANHVGRNAQLGRAVAAQQGLGPQIGAPTPGV